MTESDKASERATLLLKLGRLLAPVDELAEETQPPTNAEYRVVAASLGPDIDRWAREVGNFTTFGEAVFQQEYNDIVREPYNLRHQLSVLAHRGGNGLDKQQSLKTMLSACKQLTLLSINLVPIEWTARLHESRTPFSVYLKSHDAISTAKRRVHYFDRYLDMEFFHLYMRGLDRNLEVRLVTTKGKANFGVTNVLPVSRLAAAEFRDYKLIECQPADLHDRNLRIDDTVFFLGTSIKDAGTQPTNFSPADSSLSGHAVLDGIIAKGTVIT